MSLKICNNRLALALAITIGATGLSEAQSPGIRANGMAGAFTGVADDASAVYWNPAGLATGAFFSFVIDYAETEILSNASGDQAPHRGGSVAFSFPPVGFAYYRLGTFARPDSAVSGVGDREEVRRSVHVTTSSVGVSVLHSLTEHVVIGATPRVVHGGSSTTGDVDAGVMVAVKRFRAGLIGRNLTTPTFHVGEAGSAPVELERQARAGAAWGSGWPGQSRVVVAVDADLTRQAASDGDRRDLSAGVETWWMAYRVGARGGVRASTAGEARPVVTAGLSAGLTASLFVEGYVAAGQDENRSWGIGARFAF